MPTPALRLLAHPATAQHRNSRTRRQPLPTPGGQQAIKLQHPAQAGLRIQCLAWLPAAAAGSGMGLAAAAAQQAWGHNIRPSLWATAPVI